MKHFRLEHLAMLLRGLVWQVLNLRFGAIILKGRGAKIWIDRNVAISGIIKVGDFAKLDLRNCAKGSIGPGFSIGDFSILRLSGSKHFICPHFEAGERVTFGPYCNIGGGFGVRIGNDVIAGPYVSIHPESHSFEGATPIREQPVAGTGIVIGDDCWLSAKCTFLDGSKLAGGCVLAAGAILASGETQARSIYAGVPARLLRARDAENCKDSREFSGHTDAPTDTLEQDIEAMTERASQ